MFFSSMEIAVQYWKFFKYKIRKADASYAVRGANTLTPASASANLNSDNNSIRSVDYNL